MRQVFLENGLVRIKEVCQPILDKQMVLVAVHYSCISPGTEQATINNAQSGSLLHKIPEKIAKVLESLTHNGLEGTRALIREKMQGSLQMLGYSCSGKVIAVGSKVNRFRPGDFVACAGAGFANHASMVCVPENLVAHVRDESLLKHASVSTLGAIALQGLRRASVQLGETVCVLGLGLLGQLTVQLAKLSGATVIGIDLLEDRLTLAKQHGADFVINAKTSSVIEQLATHTNHYGVDVTIVTAASKTNDIMQQAMEITRKKGKVVVVGDVGLGLERSPLYQKEIDLLISCSYGPGRYDSSYEQQGIDYPYAYVRWTENRNMQAFVTLLEQKKIIVDTLIPDCFDVDNVESAYAAIKEQQALAALISYQEHIEKPKIGAVQHNDAHQNDEETPPRFIPAMHGGTIRVGVIGAGGFAKVKLMPIVSRIDNVKINAIVDANVATSLTISKLYQASRALTEDDALFNENLVDAVIISSPHKYHCDQALTALKHGKAVFLEKPMVTDFEQLDRLYAFLQQHPMIPFCVDYNRSFAPCIKKIKTVITQRTSPLMIFYRMNAGFISRDHWIQTEIGAGRIIGEACHIIDLFYFLTDSYATAVSVESLKPSHDDLFPTDNFSVQLSFADGSVCTLLYTALGHAGLGKERMELFFDSKSIVMDDYKTLQGFGLASSFNESKHVSDKGHESLITTFFNNLKDSSFTPPISYDHLYRVAKLTLIIDQLACQGGGIKEL